MYRIMTSNIWGDYFGNEVETREKGLFDTFVRYSPDVLGVQEITKGWHESKLMTEWMPGAGYKILDNSGELVNYTTLLVKTSKWNVLESGYERLESTEDKSKSIQWAVLEDKQTGTIIGVCNTHFEWRHGEEYDLGRESNANQICDRMDYIQKKYGCEVFAFGDMNANFSKSIFRVYNERNAVCLHTLADKRSDFCTHHGDPVRGEDGLYHGKKTELPFERSIDHIVALRGSFKVHCYTVVDDADVLDSTDHSPVYVDIEL